MPLSEVALLQQSPIVSRISSESSQSAPDRFRMKIRVELVNGWRMDYWEHLAPRHRRYSFQVLQGNQPIVRWDNAPHHAHVSTFPHHKHVGPSVVDSEEMDVAKVLLELEGIMQTP